MTDAVLIALISTVPSIMALIGVVYSIRVSLGNRVVIDKVEKQTNHLTEALVASTKVASRAEGKEEGRVEGEIKAAAVARGRVEGLAEGVPVPVAIIPAAEPLPVTVKK